MRNLVALCVLLFAGVAASAAFAAKPFTEAQVPSALKPWLPWVTQDIVHDTCPFFYDRTGDHVCAWPTRLSLSLDAKGAEFSYQITLYETPEKKPARILLPGSRETWPQNVKIDMHPVPVLPSDERPTLLLEPGNYTISGSFTWDTMPASLRVPPSMGLVQIKVNGREIAIPDIEGDQLWIQRGETGTQAAQENRLEAKLFRKVTDDIPLMMDTAIRLEVSGKQREEDLGKILPAGFIPTGVTSELPARLEQDGTLRMQLRPGSWEVHIEARAPEPVTTLALPAPGGILPEQEIWSFEPMNQLRLTQVEGVNAIDPSQTELPDEWRSFPAYLMTRASRFTLTEKKRGATDSVPDQLSLSRDIWLDFSGKGFTFNDTISGAIHQSSRLEVTSGVMLGDATINGKSQYITRIARDGNAGVEVREGPLSLKAGSRIESGTPRFSATGWKSNFDRMDARLFLPPGWTLFSYSGADSVSQSWVSNWSLLDVFLVLLAVVATARLYGLGAGALGLAALTLLQHELRGFTPLVLLILATVALRRTLPPGRFHIGITWFQRAVFVLLLCSVGPFAVMHLREAIYPQLKPTAREGYYAQSMAAQSYNAGAYARKQMIEDRMDKDAGEVEEEKSAAVAGEPMSNAVSPGALPTPPPPEPMVINGAVRMRAGGGGMALQKPMAMPQAGHMNIARGTLKKAKEMQRGVAQASTLASSFASPANDENYQQYAPDTKVQTGFGNATWRSNVIHLGWSGMVDPSVTLRLILISAHQNLALAVLRVLLMAAFIALLLGAPVMQLKKALSGRSLALLLATGLTLMAAGNGRAEPEESPLSSSGTEWVFPPDSLLQALKAKLEQTINEPPSCAPQCASVARTHLSATGNTLVILQEIHAQENVAFPLPGNVTSWRPSGVWVDDLPAAGLREADGYLYVNLGEGVHHIKMAGPLPSRDTVGITLPVAPHFTSQEAEGWEIQGIHENGLADNSLQLIRTAKHEASAEKTLERTAITPFFVVERTFTLAQQWQVTTVVRRITPEEDAAATHIPLLPGETITSADIPVKNGEAYVNFDPDADEVTWQSVIAPAPSLHLAAPKTKPWVEIWRLSVSNLWHVSVSGIPRVYLSDSQSAGVNSTGNAVNFWQWQPWPGEAVDIAVTRPTGVEGDTRTLDASHLTITPGQRSMDMLLTLKIRSSLGGQHDVTLPQGAVLLEVKQNEAVLPIQLKQNLLSLPLTPGENLFSIRWKQDDALPLAFHVPAVLHGLARSVNAETTINMPRDRWILFTRGPQMGPAVLFWSWIPVILIFSYALGKLRMTPLRMEHWFFLLLGLNQVTIFNDFIIIAWLLGLGCRARYASSLTHPLAFNAAQATLAAATCVSLILLFASISQGLVGVPDMHVVGGGSYATHLHWYRDITAGTLPQPKVISVSIWAYRVLMLLWALWLAFSLVNWLRWGWRNFAEGGTWRKGTWNPRQG